MNGINGKAKFEYKLIVIILSIMYILYCKI